MLKHLNFREYREPGANLYERLPWSMIVAPGVVALKAGLLQRTVRLRGHDTSTHSAAELAGAMRRLSDILAGLGGGWSLFSEVRREPVGEYPDSRFAEPVCALFDSVRRHAFTECGDELFCSVTYLTFVYQPPAPTQQTLLARLFAKNPGAPEAGSARGERLAANIEHFVATSQVILGRLSAVYARADWLTDDETLTYLHACVSTRAHRVRCPESGAMYLDHVLPDCPVQAGSDLIVGDQHVCVVSIKGYPGQTTPRILCRLEGLGFPFRFTTRALMMSKAEATRELSKYERRFAQSTAKLSSALTGQEGLSLVNRASVSRMHEVSGALESVERGHVGALRLTQLAIVWDADGEVARERAHRIQEVLGDLGFASVLETANPFSAWLASLPGHVWAHPRRAIVTTDNLAHLLPTSTTWLGRERNGHLGGPAHVLTVTGGSTPFRLNLNVGDVGHTLVMGPTGSGKSTLLGTLAMQWMRYPGARVVFFDKGKSARAATLAVGGEWLEPGAPGSGVCFAPLSDVRARGPERVRAHDWLCGLFCHEGLTLTAPEREELWNALGRHIAPLPAGERTMSQLLYGLQTPRLRAAVKPYCRGGAWGELFDASDERMGAAAWTTIEMGWLMETATDVVAPTLAHMFARLGEQFTDGRPTLLVLDEAWVYLDNPIFLARIKQWLKELRKYSVYVVFATQSVADALDSPVAPTLIESCPTRILLANPGATSPHARGYYTRLGLTDTQIDTLARMTPRRDYLFDNPEGSRVFDLGLGPLELALVGASSPEDQAMVQAHFNQCGREPGLAFAASYLHERGFERIARKLMARRAS